MKLYGTIGLLKSDNWSDSDQVCVHFGKVEGCQGWNNLDMGGEVMNIAADAIRAGLDDLIQRHPLLDFDIQILRDARDFIGHLTERIEELEETERLEDC